VKKKTEHCIDGRSFVQCTLWIWATHPLLPYCAGRSGEQYACTLPAPPVLHWSRVRQLFCLTMFLDPGSVVAWAENGCLVECTLHSAHTCIRQLITSSLLHDDSSLMSITAHVSWLSEKFERLARKWQAGRAVCFDACRAPTSYLRVDTDLCLFWYGFVSVWPWR